MQTLAVLAIWYVAISAVSFLTLWRDKRAALCGGWRTPEATLHLLELLGGWPGTMLGQRLLRHKSRKLTYRFVLCLIAAAHLAGWAAALLLMLARGID